jgi:hypothetical protein
MQSLLNTCHPETHEILNNARAAYQSGEISKEDYNDVVLTCFRAEQEWKLKGMYPETKDNFNPVTSLTA